MKCLFIRIFTIKKQHSWLCYFHSSQGNGIEKKMRTTQRSAGCSVLSVFYSGSIYFLPSSYLSTVSSIICKINEFILIKNNDTLQLAHFMFLFCCLNISFLKFQFFSVYSSIPKNAKWIFISMLFISIESVRTELTKPT